MSETDLEIFFGHQQDPDANRMAVFPPRDRDAFFVHWRTKVLGNPDTRSKTIVVDGAVAGYVASWKAEGRTLVGYWVGREHWGRGVASGALREFLAHETARPLYAFVAATNRGSIRVLEKCGFHVEGDLRKAADDDVEEWLYRRDT